MSSPGGDIPIACDLSVFTAAERADHLARGRQVFAAADDVREDADGYSFTFAGTPALDAEVALWVENERRCCPFFRFDVRHAAGARLILAVSGPGAAKEILRAAIEEYAVVG
jgi:hypothetical protein